MSKVTGKLTLFFEGSFWVGIFERIEGGKLSAAKVIFGKEPKDYEVFAFILKHYDRLQFSPTVTAAIKETGKNPKRMQRAVKKQLQENGTGTKSQQALKLQHEQAKQARKIKSREQKAVGKLKKFDLKQQRKGKSTRDIDALSL